MRTTERHQDNKQIIRIKLIILAMRCFQCTDRLRIYTLYVNTQYIEAYTETNSFCTARHCGYRIPLKQGLPLCTELPIRVIGLFIILIE